VAVVVWPATRAAARPPRSRVGRGRDHADPRHDHDRAAGHEPDQLGAPKTATEAASALSRVEAALRTDDKDPTHRLPLGWEQQLAYGACSTTATGCRDARRRAAELRAAVNANLERRPR